MAENKTEYIRSNHIDTISLSNRYTTQQKHTLNYIIQVLLNNDTERLNRWQKYTRCRKFDKTRDLAMSLVLAGTSVQDQYIVDWVYNNGYANTMTKVELHHKRYLNKSGFNIENKSLYQINEPIYKVLFGPGSDADSDADDDSSLSDVFVGISVYKSEQDAKANHNPVSTTITKVSSNQDYGVGQLSEFVCSEQ